MSADLVLIVAAAFGAGLVDAMVGGGGLIQLPALLTAYPSTPPAILLGTNKFASIFGTGSAVLRFARGVRIPWRTLLHWCRWSSLALSAVRVLPRWCRRRSSGRWCR